MNRHIMVRKYRTSEADKEIFPDITLRDLIFMSAYVLILRLFTGLVHVRLRPAYTIFNVLAAFFLTRSIGSTNRPKRLYHLILLKGLRMTEDLIYLPVERKEEKTDDENKAL